MSELNEQLKNVLLAANDSFMAGYQQGRKAGYTEGYDAALTLIEEMERKINEYEAKTAVKP